MQHRDRSTRFDNVIALTGTSGHKRKAVKDQQESQTPLAADEALKLLGFPVEEYGEDVALDDCRYILSGLAEDGVSEDTLRYLEAAQDMTISDSLLTLHRGGVHSRRLFEWEFYAADFAGGTGSSEVNALWSP